jgi:hypothetical protein
MSTEHLLVFVFLLWSLFVALRVSKKNAEDKKARSESAPLQHCMACGDDFKSSSDKPLRGNTVIEVILWICYLIPGVIYSYWRRSEKFKSVCPVCHSNQVVPITSKAAIAHAKSLEKAMT